MAAVKEAYPEPEALTMCPRLTAAPRLPSSCWCNQAVDNQISVEDVRERIRENFPRRPQV